MRRTSRTAAGWLSLAMPASVLLVLTTATLAGWHLAGVPVVLAATEPAAEPATPAWQWHLPAGFPEPRVPATNPMSAAKVELGRHLFYDPRLSGNGDYACASCHRQELAFTDGRARALGATGEFHPLSAMSLTNVAYSASLGWADAGLLQLEVQARM